MVMPHSIHAFTKGDANIYIYCLLASHASAIFRLVSLMVNTVEKSFECHLVICTTWLVRYEVLLWCALKMQSVFLVYDTSIRWLIWYRMMSH
jgi:hypothetical protein